MADPDTTLPMLLTGALGGAVSAGALWAYSVFSPRSQFWAPVIRSLPQREAVALTFDDGPDERFTPRILDILAEQGVKATFFVLGRYVEKRPELARRIFDEGHTLGNHSFDHDHFGVNRDRRYWISQVNHTQTAVADATGQPPLVFRPPMGFKTRHIAAAAREAKLPIVGWSVRGLDTKGHAADRIASRVVRHTSGHDIILLHDGVEPHRKADASQEETVKALPGILKGIADKKLRVVGLLEALVAGSEDVKAAAERTRARTAES